MTTGHDSASRPMCPPLSSQEICLTNEVAHHREVTFLGKVPIFGKVVLTVLVNGCPFR
jgi:hypothetical protein